jgi:hypothetical protein
VNVSQTVIGILGTGAAVAFGAACAYALAAGCLRLIIGAVTRDQYNVNDCARPRPES